ncbi:MAG: CRTAC1 family protein [Gemmataceae bacterium]|nr:CRTAC1 family protein [Gemmataceae bacterium]
MSTSPRIRLLLMLVGGALLAALPSCGHPSPPLKPTVSTAVPSAGPPYFEDVTAASGIAFTYRNGQEAGHYAILESLGGGVGLIDFDGDGLLDVFLPGGGYFDGPDKQQIKGHPCKLYKNLGGFRFTDATAAAGLDRTWPYTHGCAVGDFDNDGWPDLLVTGWGGVLLFRNVAVDPQNPSAGRRFADVTAQAGLSDPRWSTSAAWADFDGDGWADLFICHYVDWSMPANNPKCDGYTPNVKQDVCPPTRFKGLPDVLYRNHGDGTFRDVSVAAGIRQVGAKEGDAGKGLGVVAADLDGDGRPDLYVANDTEDNFLYLNRGKFHFEECARSRGTARDEMGRAQGSMGLDVGDFNRSGWPSLFVTNYENEMHALYRHLGKEGHFHFSTTTTGLAAIGQRYVGWGTQFLDVDNDGWLDLIISNGHVIRHPVGAGVRQKPVLFWNDQGRFRDVTPRGGTYFHAEHCGRGLAVGDLDNDGWPDLVLSHVNAPAAVLRGIGGRTPEAHHWLGIELVGRGRRNIVGTKIEVHVDGRTLTYFAKGGGSWASACDPRHLVGLGRAAAVERIVVTWCHGQRQQWPGKDLPVDRYWRFVEGEPAPQVVEKKSERG